MGETPAEVGLRWEIVERERRFRSCSRCGREWPERCESCPNCALWLGNALRTVDERWLVPYVPTAVRGWQAGDGVWNGLPADFRGPLVEYASILCVATVLPLLAAGIPWDALQRWFSGLPELLRGRDALLGGPPDGHGGLRAIFVARGDDRDHAQQAVRAAIEARQLAAHLRLAAVPSGVRLFFGINTGPVALWREADAWSVTGAAPDRAERLATCLGPDRVVLSEATYHLARDVFEAHGAAPLDWDDRALPSAVYVLRGPKAVVTWRGLLSEHRAPLVDRQPERAALKGAWEDARRGHGQVVHVVAEPGGGKSKLLDAFALHLAESGDAAVWRAWGACYGGSDLQLLRDLLAPVWQPAGLPRTEALAALRERLRGCGADSDATFATLAGLFGFAEPGAPPETGLVETLHSLVAAAATRKPLVLLLDDLHWADRASLDAVCAALPRWRDRPVLAVLAYRPSLASRFAPARFPADVHLELPPLDPQATETLLMALEPDCLPRWRRVILEAAQGSPLYVEEAVGLLRDEGVLPGGAGFPELRLPRALPALLLRRIQVWADQQLTGLELQAGLTLVRPEGLLPVIEAVEHRIDDWLDRIEAGGYLGRVEVGLMLRHLRAVEHRLILLRWRIGAAPARHNRLRAAVERLYAGAHDEWQEAIRTYAEQNGDRTGAFYQALEAAESAKLRRDYAAATNFYRLALSLRPLPAESAADLSVRRLHQELGAMLATRGLLTDAQAAFAEGLAGEADPGGRLALAVQGALASAWAGQKGTVIDFARAAEEAWRERTAADVGGQPAGREARQAEARLQLARAALAVVRGDPQAAATAAAAAARAAEAGAQHIAVDAALLHLAACGGGSGWRDALEGVLSHKPEGGIDAADVRFLLLLARHPGPGGPTHMLRMRYARRVVGLAQALRFDGWREAAARTLGALQQGEGAGAPDWPVAPHGEQGPAVVAAPDSTVAHIGREESRPTAKNNP